jgi:hypothetical protein
MVRRAIALFQYAPSLVHDLARSARGATSIWLLALHAFRLLSDDRGARPYRPGGDLLALSIGYVRSLGSVIAAADLIAPQ